MHEFHLILLGSFLACASWLNGLNASSGVTDRDEVQEDEFPAWRCPSRIGAAAGMRRGSSSTTTPQPQPLNWTACDDVQDTQCTTIQVPVDHANPGGAKISLRLARVQATGPAKKRGMLLIIPGGPGVGIGDTFGTNRKNFHIDDFFPSTSTWLVWTRAGRREQLNQLSRHLPRSHRALR